MPRRETFFLLLIRMPLVLREPLGESWILLRRKRRLKLTLLRRKEILIISEESKERSRLSYSILAWRSSGTSRTLWSKVLRLMRVKSSSLKCKEITTDIWLSSRSKMLTTNLMSRLPTRLWMLTSKLLNSPRFLFRPLIQSDLDLPLTSQSSIMRSKMTQRKPVNLPRWLLMMPLLI